TGSIGSACARLLCRKAGHVRVVGRDAAAVQRLVDSLGAAVGTVSGATDLSALRDADIVVSATNSAGPLIRPEHLRPGTAVYDLALPPDVSAAVREMGLNVTVYSGGDVIAPGTPDFGMDFGLPPGHAYACMAETIALALEGRYERYTLGRAIAPEQVLTICAIAERHGFRPAPLRAAGGLVEVPSCAGVV
ncbi:MAG: shikimate dehydrogenase, partial [Anaerolineae bacterium]